MTHPSAPILSSLYHATQGLVSFSIYTTEKLTCVAPAITNQPSCIPVFNLWPSSTDLTFKLLSCLTETQWPYHRSSISILVHRWVIYSESQANLKHKFDHITLLQNIPHWLPTVLNQTLIFQALPFLSQVVPVTCLFFSTSVSLW